MTTVDPRLLEIHKLSFKGVFSCNIYYINYITTKRSDDDDDEGFPYLVFNDADRYTEENDRIKYLVFTPIFNIREMIIVTASVLEKMVNVIHNFFREMFAWVIKMLQCEKKDVLEGININKTSASRVYALSLLVF